MLMSSLSNGKVTFTMKSSGCIYHDNHPGAIYHENYQVAFTMRIIRLHLP